ncbi:hypothetical protein TELCIR_00117 [Teladorsagia circumcincta]|uniref:Uncharacterized protein n=1 Tax=Teladorsagia circumcincta TaxID=45464 RepID=A0A2G9V5V1_TELCI|nr:hypothetical protein TELCIR_00117 [Teladorsagia circumcincta]
MPNSGQSEAVAETGDGTMENPITFDDPSSILTPAALSMHEEMLRAQQKKIEMLLEELAKSQAHLKQEQQLILTAKKAQEPLEQTYEMPAHNFEQKLNIIEEDQQSIIICDASGMQLHPDQTVIYHQNGRVMQDGKQPTVDMEEIFKSVLEDASRAMGSGTTAAQSIDCTMTNNAQESQQTMVVCHQQWQQPQAPVAYSQDIDDLMAVLRDDQDGGLKAGSFQMDLGVGYGSEELADLLGEDWLDCADRSIANNGQYAPYANEPHDMEALLEAPSGRFAFLVLTTS